MSDTSFQVVQAQRIFTERDIQPILPTIEKVLRRSRIRWLYFGCGATAL